MKERVYIYRDTLPNSDILKKFKGRYLLKPNFFTNITSEKGATTSIELVFSVARMLLRLGSTPIIGECPAMASYARPDIIFEGLGINRLCNENNVELRVLDRDKPYRLEVPDGKILHEIWVPETLTMVDGIINIPKLKTHQLTTLTCAVKNFFGLQQGGSKANHHRRVANDPEAFSQLLLDIYSAIRHKVSLNIVDAIVAMEGEGPTTGDPVNMDTVLVGENACAVDYVAALMAGWDPMTIPTIRFASDRDMGPRSLEDIEIVGESIDRMIKPLRKPLTSSDLEQFHRIKMPIKCDQSKCRKCGICSSICPVGAVSRTDIPEIDQTLCIQCFCCTELCPNGALRAIRSEN